MVASVLVDERAALVVRPEGNRAVARREGEPKRLDDGEGRNDRRGEGEVLDHLVVLVVVDTEEGEREHGGTGDVTATVTEGVTDGSDGEERLRRNDEDASENRGVRVVAAAEKR